MKIFVTGGSGLVGSTTIDEFLARGDQVLAIDNFATGRRDNLTPHAKLTFQEGSIADKPLVEQLVGDFKPDVVIHTAASYKDPNDWYNDTLTNCVGTVNVVKAAKDSGCKRLVYFQTALCYGVRPQQQPITLNHPINPVNSSYAISKTAGENYVQFSGMDWVTFRLAKVVGPRGVSGPLAIFYQRLSQGKQCFVTPARRDFVFSRDLASNVMRAADGIGHGTYHFSSGKDVAIIDVYDAVVSAMKLNSRPQPDMRALGADDAPTILLDPSRTFEDFGQIEFTPLDQIVSSTVEYYGENGVEGGYTHLKLDT
jgi:UDP-glucose 4-epimerase